MRFADVAFVLALGALLWALAVLWMVL